MTPPLLPYTFDILVLIAASPRNGVKLNPKTLPVVR